MLSYMVLTIVSLVLVFGAQARVQGAYAKWSRVGARSGITGAEVARRMMRDEGIFDVQLETVEGEMTDHYDPRAKTVRLSQDVYHGSSIAALGIAAHEIGHVIQDARGYAPMKLRGVVYPISAFGSNFGYFFIFGGVVLSAMMGAQMLVLVQVGIWLYAASVAFALITLPVEFDASRRAKLALAHGGILDAEEMGGVRNVLGAAAMTYVAAAAVAVMQLIHLILQFSGASDNRE